MLKRRDVSVNKGYVNESGKILRRVNQEVDPWTIKYSMHDLETGVLIRSPHRLCKKRNMIDWADREATDEEMSRIHVDEFGALFKEPAAAANDVPNYEATIGEIQVQTCSDSLIR